MDNKDLLKAGDTLLEGGLDEILLKATDIPLLSAETIASSNPGKF